MDFSSKWFYDHPLMTLDNCFYKINTRLPNEDILEGEYLTIKMIAYIRKNNMESFINFSFFTY